MLKEIENLYAKASLLYSEQDINAQLNRMAKEIETKLGDTNPVVVCVMTGGLVPMGQLITKLHFHLEMDYVHATRYQGEIQGGELQWIARPRTSLKDRTVLVIDDILDGGVTLAEIKKDFEKAGAKDVYTAVLVDKKRERPAEGLQQADFVGLEIDNHFIFGYGMDYKGYFRNIPGIFIVRD
jgi:hypoxanthine phosphoribosyltransferase